MFVYYHMFTDLHTYIFTSLRICAYTHKAIPAYVSKITSVKMFTYTLITV